MPDIHIHRKHQLGMETVRKMARQWAEKAEQKYDMECTYDEGQAQDTLCFSRAGVKGTLDVFPDALDFHAQLGFLMGVFKDRIEVELHGKLDTMLAEEAAQVAEPASACQTSIDIASSGETAVQEARRRSPTK